MLQPYSVAVAVLAADALVECSCWALSLSRTHPRHRYLKLYEEKHPQIYQQKACKQQVKQVDVRESGQRKDQRCQQRWLQEFLEVYGEAQRNY